MGFKLSLKFAEMFENHVHCYVSIRSFCLVYFLPFDEIGIGIDFLFSCGTGPSDHVGLHWQICVPLLLIMVCNGLTVIMSQ